MVTSAAGEPEAVEVSVRRYAIRSGAMVEAVSKSAQAASGGELVGVVVGWGTGEFR
jgi:hypothetical protein